MASQRQLPRDVELASVPVFPLPDLVVFPGNEVPLHFFEPRYRALVEDAVAGDGLFATVRLEPGWQADYEGRPPIKGIGTLGRIIAHRRRDDGTHDVVVRGIERGRLHELPPSPRGYRRARVQPLDNIGVDRVGQAALSTLAGCAQSLASVIRKRHPDFSLGMDAFDSPADFADALAHRVVLAPDERQRLLETLDVRVRVARLVEIVGEIVLRFGPRSDAQN